MERRECVLFAGEVDRFGAAGKADQQIGPLGRRQFDERFARHRQVTRGDEALGDQAVDGGFDGGIGEAVLDRGLFGLEFEDLGFDPGELGPCDSDLDLFILILLPGGAADLEQGGGALMDRLEVLEGRFGGDQLLFGPLDGVFNRLEIGFE